MGKKNEKATAKQTSNITPTALVRGEKQQLEEYYKSQAAKKKTSEKADTPKKTDKKSATKQSNVITPTTRQTTSRSGDAWTWRELSSEDQERAKRQKSEITPTAVQMPTLTQRQGGLGSPGRMIGETAREARETKLQTSQMTPTALTHRERQTARAVQDARRDIIPAGTTPLAVVRDRILPKVAQIQEIDQKLSFLRTEIDPSQTGPSSAYSYFVAENGTKEQLEHKRSVLQRQVDQAARYVKYEHLRSNSDFREKSHQLPAPNVTPTDREPYFYDRLYYAVNDFVMPDGRKARDVMAEHGYTYRDVPNETRDMFNYLYVTQGREAAKQYIEDVADRSFTLGGSLGTGFVQGSGLGGLIDLGTGGKRARQNQRLVAQAQEDHPFAFGTGQVGGATAQWVATKKLIGGLPGVSSLGPVANDMVSTGVSAAAGDAARNISPLMTGDISPEGYALSVLANGAGGAVGSAAARGVTNLGTKALFGADKTLNTKLAHNIFANAINQGAGGAAFTVANAGTRALIDPNYNPTGEELVKDAIVSFAFQTISSAVHLKAQTKQAKAVLDSDLAALERDFYRMAEAKQAGVVTETDLVDAMRARSARLRSTLNSTQYIGHGQEVKEALAFLDQLDDFITQAGSVVNARTLPGMAGSGISPRGNLAVPQRELPTPGLVNSALPAPGAAVGGQSGVSRNEDPQDVSLLLKRELEGLQSSGEEDTIKKTPSIQLDDQETHAVLGYKSSESYPLNAAIRDGTPLTPTQQQMMDGLDRALPKMPIYQGKVYRRIGFDMVGREALKAFLDEHKPGADIQYPAFTSTSSDLDGYPVEGDLTVTLVIESQGGRDLDGHGNNMEREVVFPRGSAFHIDRVETDKAGKPVIYMREVANDGTGQLHSEEQYGGVQPMQEVPRKVYLREVPRVDPQAETGGAVPRLRGEGTPSVGIDAQDVPLLIKRELRKIAQAEEAAKAVPLLKRYMLALPEDGGLKQREIDAKVSDAMQRVLAERGRAEEESRPLRERLAQVQAEGEAGLAQTRAQYEKAVAERETETAREKDGKTAERGKTKSKSKLTKDTTDDTLQKGQGGRQFQSEKIFAKHYGKHSEEFEEMSVEEYLSRANELADSPLSDDVVALTRSDGSVAKYRFSTNEFVAINADGTIRTFFKPKDGKEYWQNELDRN